MTSAMCPKQLQLYLTDDMHVELGHGRNAVETHHEITRTPGRVTLHLTLQALDVLLRSCLHRISLLKHQKQSGQVNEISLHKTTQ